MVKRYDMESYTKHFYEDSVEIYHMKERECGEYVKFEDYAVLAAQVESLAKDRDEWREAAAKVISVMQLSGIKVNNDYFTKCLREIRAEAGRVGFVAGAKSFSHAGGDIHLIDVDSVAGRYADKIRRGE